MENIKTTKAIRFKLDAGGENERIRQKIENLNNTAFDLVNFVSNLKDFIASLNKVMYYHSRSDNMLYLNEKLTLKAEWMRKFAKNEYAEHKRRQKNVTRRQQYTIADYGVTDLIDDTICQLENTCDALAGDAAAQLHERAKRARTGLLLKSLYARNALPCLVELAENVVDKKELANASLHLKSKGRKLMDQLESGMQVFLPEQSRGAVIAKASMNFYTLDKRPIDYERKIQNLLERLQIQIEVELRRLPNFSTALKDVIREDVAGRCGDRMLCVGDSPFMDENAYTSLRQVLKNIMAEQKKLFSEMMQDDASFDDLRDSDLYLFRNISKQEFEQYKDYTQKIECIATQKNQCLDKERQKKFQSRLEALRKERGSLISEAERKTKNQFRSYKDFSAWYRNVALRHGRILAQMKAIERERVESQMLQYWALIVERNDRHQLVLVPKENAKECNRLLKGRATEGKGARLYWFESFTFRSLQKLCFGNLESGSNTFNQGIAKELRDYVTIDRRGNRQFYSGEHEFEGDEQKKIKFYQDVLNSRYAGQVLRLPMTELRSSVINAKFDSLDDFKIALEKVCYQRFVCADERVIDELKREFGAQVFDITSLDLQNAERSKGKETTYEHTDKYHTALWKQFWTTENVQGQYDIRLNPELVITYRKPKESRIEKYGKGTERYDAGKKNRYLHEQLTLIATISEHCNSPLISQAFSSLEDIKGNIEAFNRKVNAQQFNFAFGIDNGEVELSTLGVYLPAFGKPSVQEKLEMLNRVKEYGFKVLTITDMFHTEADLNGKERRLLQNPSYFLKEDLYCRTFGKTPSEYAEMFAQVFEEKHLLSLDLSTAKVISGHIVTNGDVVSLFNLWMRHAQRNVFEMNEHSDKEGAKRIVLKKSSELDGREKRKFIDYLNAGNKNYAKLTEEEKEQYVGWIYKQWSFEDVEKNSVFEKVKNGHKLKGNYLHNVLMAVSFLGEELTGVADIFNIRNVFKLRKDFYCIKSEDEILSEINSYNVRTISDEELDLKLNQMKSSLVANVVGVLDFLYKQYKERFGGEGIIAMEDFDLSKIESDRSKFSGNIYRMLERKLYLKLQNYGLVPPVKKLLQVREDKNIKQIGNVRFVDCAGTSQECPVCKEGRLGHTETCSAHCGFSSVGIMHSNDGIAGYNIAERGFFENKTE